MGLGEFGGRNAADGFVLLGGGDWGVTGNDYSDADRWIWNVSDGVTVHELLGPADTVDVRYSRDGQRLASASRDRAIKIWDSEKGGEIATLRGHTAGLTSLAFTGDGKKVISGNLDRTVRIGEVE